MTHESTVLETPGAAGVSSKQPFIRHPDVYVRAPDIEIRLTYGETLPEATGTYESIEISIPETIFLHGSAGQGCSCIHAGHASVFSDLVKWLNKCNVKNVLLSHAPSRFEEPDTPRMTVDVDLVENVMCCLPWHVASLCSIAVDYLVDLPASRALDRLAHWRPPACDLAAPTPAAVHLHVQELHAGSGWGEALSARVASLSDSACVSMVSIGCLILETAPCVISQERLAMCLLRFNTVTSRRPAWFCRPTRVVTSDAAPEAIPRPIRLNFGDADDSTTTTSPSPQVSGDASPVDELPGLRHLVLIVTAPRDSPPPAAVHAYACAYAHGEVATGLALPSAAIAPPPSGGIHGLRLGPGLRAWSPASGAPPPRPPRRGGEWPDAPDARPACGHALLPGVGRCVGLQRTSAVRLEGLVSLALVLDATAPAVAWGAVPQLEAPRLSRLGLVPGPLLSATIQAQLEDGATLPVGALVDRARALAATYLVPDGGDHLLLGLLQSSPEFKFLCCESTRHGAPALAEFARLFSEQQLGDATKLGRRSRAVVQRLALHLQPLTLDLGVVTCRAEALARILTRAFITGLAESIFRLIYAVEPRLVRSLGVLRAPCLDRHLADSMTTAAEAAGASFENLTHGFFDEIGCLDVFSAASAVHAAPVRTAGRAPRAVRRSLSGVEAPARPMTELLTACNVLSVQQACRWRQAAPNVRRLLLVCGRSHHLGDGVAEEVHPAGLLALEALIKRPLPARTRAGATNAAFRAPLAGEPCVANVDLHAQPLGLSPTPVPVGKRPRLAATPSPTQEASALTVSGSRTSTACLRMCMLLAPVCYHYQRRTLPRSGCEEPPELPLSPSAGGGEDLLARLRGAAGMDLIQSFSRSLLRRYQPDQPRLARVITLIDWDDTILPTTSRAASLMSASDSVCFADLDPEDRTLFARLAEAIARSIAAAAALGEVVIVSNGTGWWLERSLRLFPPRFTQQLRAAHVRIVSAQDHACARIPGPGAQDADYAALLMEASTRWKARTFVDTLAIHGVAQLAAVMQLLQAEAGAPGADRRWRDTVMAPTIVLSIGDGEQERRALLGIGRSRSRRASLASNGGTPRPRRSVAGRMSMTSTASEDVGGSSADDPPETQFQQVFEKLCESEGWKMYMQNHRGAGDDEQRKAFTELKTDALEMAAGLPIAPVSLRFPQEPSPEDLIAVHGMLERAIPALVNHALTSHQAALERTVTLPIQGDASSSENNYCALDLCLVSLVNRR